MKTLKGKLKDRKKQMKIHLEEFGKGKNRDIDSREKFIMTMLIPVIEKDIIENMERLKEKMSKEILRINGPLGILQIDRIIDEVVGEFDTPHRSWDVDADEWDKSFPNREKGESEICKNCRMKHYDSPKGKRTGISYGWANNNCSDFVRENHEHSKTKLNGGKDDNSKNI